MRGGDLMDADTTACPSCSGPGRHLREFWYECPACAAAFCAGLYESLPGDGYERVACGECGQVNLLAEPGERCSRWEVRE